MDCLIFHAFLLYICIYGINCQSPEVEIPQGRLRGGTEINLDGGVYYSFKSIQYGRPPVGENRFKASVLADPWEGVKDATQDSPVCMQSALGLGGQEDCLYLNVFTPGLPEENVTQLPVMVWIHGGAFILGSGDIGPQYLLTKDVIIVSINYRVGIMGFLSLDDANLGVTGNAGLKDQVLALQWVRNNIEYFGGDPNNVMIFGSSAGAMSVQLLVMSPMANGLINKAIAQSGDAVTPTATPQSRNNAVRIAERMGIQTENWEDMLVSLQEAPAVDLILTDQSFLIGLYPLFSGPIVEIPANGTFLQERPIDIIKSGTYNQIPFIIGISDAEGLLLQALAVIFSGENILIEDFTEYVPREFNIQGTILEELLAIAIRQFYYGDTEPSRDNITQAVALTTDYFFGFSAYRTVRNCISTAQNPVYFYYFTSITELNGDRDESYADFPGAGHGDEVPYLLYDVGTPSYEVGSLEERGIRNMVNLWTNFAIYGNPTPENSSSYIWEPVTEDQFSYLHIATEESYTVNAVFEPERMEFWWSLHEQFAGK